MEHHTASQFFDEIVTDLARCSIAFDAQLFSEVFAGIERGNQRLADLRKLLLQSTTRLADGREVFTDDLTLALDLRSSKGGVIESSFYSNLVINESGRIYELELRFCNLMSCDRINQLSALTFLNLHGNSISDISPLRPMTRLKSLCLSNNPCSDLTPLSAHHKLESLWIDYTRVSDLEPLAENKSLIVLDVTGSAVQDVSPLGGLEDLKEVIVGDNLIVDIAVFSKLLGLRFLDLSGNRIADLSPLCEHTSLEVLDISDNRLADFSPISSLTGLNSLCCSGNSVQSYWFLATLEKLELLKLDRCGLRRLPGEILSLPIEILNLAGNPGLNDIAALKEMPRLQELCIDEPEGGFTPESRTFLREFEERGGKLSP